MLFDFLRKGKKYPANQAQEPPRSEREKRSLVLYGGPPADGRSGSDRPARVLRPVPVPDPDPDPDPTPMPEVLPVYAGPPEEEELWDPFFDPQASAAEIPVLPTRDVYAGPPLDVYAGPPSWDDDYDLRRSSMDPVYAGPPRDDEEDEETGEDGPGSVPSLIYAGPEDFT